MKLMCLSVTSLNGSRVRHIVACIRTPSELGFSIFKSVEGVHTYRHSLCVAYNIGILQERPLKQIT